MSEYFAKVADNLDVKPLQTAILRQPKLFGKYTQRGDFKGSPHSEMKDIWVRYNDVTPFLEKNSFVGFDSEHDSIWYPSAYAIPQVRKVVFDLMRIVEGERLGGILITKLPPGGNIKKHSDGGWHAEYYDKYFVPILNEEGAIFGFEDGIIAPKIGEAYWFDNSVPHWVENNTDSDRIAMIVCIRHSKVEGAYREDN